MIIPKVIEVGIDVQNTINLYTDPDNIKQILADRYEGRCIKGCFIKKIEKIKKVGKCVINQDGTPNFGTIPVICEVTAIMYAVGEIINGCVVKNRDRNGIIVCITDIASIMLAPHPALESVTKGQIISIRVGAAKYVGSSVKIAINAVPYLPYHDPIIYKIGPINDAAKSMLTNVLERIEFEEAEMKRIKTENVKAWDTFDQLLYTYKEPQSDPPVGAKMLDLRDLLKDAPANIAYLSRDPRINLSDSGVYSYAPGAKFPDGAKVRTDLVASNVLILLFEDYCAHLRTIREMVNIYSTEKLLIDHRNLWQIFRKNKV